MFNIHEQHQKRLPRAHWVAFFTLARREIARFFVLKSMTIFPQLITTILYIIIFGFSLSGRIKEIHGFSYIEFIFPGLVLMGVILNSYNNAANTLFVCRYDFSIQDLLLTPLSYFQIALAYTLSSMIRGLVVGIFVLLCGKLLLNIHFFSLSILILFSLSTTMIFSSFGIMIGLWAERWDDVGLFITYIVTPLIFLGGIFYSIDMLPIWWQKVSLFNPIFFMVNGFRYGILGFQEFSLITSLLTVLSLQIVLFGWTVYLFKIGYKLKT